MARHIPVSPNHPVEIAPANGRFWTPAELESLVGGPIQAIYLNGGVRDAAFDRPRQRLRPEDGRSTSATMYIRLEGILSGLPVNPIASTIAIAAGNFPYGTRIVGDVVIVPFGEEPDAHEGSV